LPSTFVYVSPPDVDPLPDVTREVALLPAGDPALTLVLVRGLGTGAGAGFAQLYTQLAEVVCPAPSVRRALTVKLPLTR
jgi:hypothetical protein